MSPWIRYGFLFVYMAMLYVVFAWSMNMGNSKSTSAAYATGVIIIAAIIGPFLEKRFSDKKSSDEEDTPE